MIGMLTAKDLSDKNIREIVDMLRKYGSISYTEVMAGRYVEKAKNALSGFENSQTRDILLDIADYALNREK
jgi:octaprenyl-diphosphate synthase